eukprot:TRINITY_DN6831_c0_g1_i1.p1 TRINITY_DN6831_c0_g1~~TRINITY_DN6831_c0_g1_i1.p1  ORF type:complete len:372 (+),score=45.45 TRINITY_DN6831_c0_g1_i1:181-1296(+)
MASADGATRSKSDEPDYSYLRSSRESGRQEGLIPGLPEEVAFRCLLHVPRRYHRVMRRVCKLWSKLLESDDFFNARAKAQLAEPWIHVLTKIEGGRNPWRAFDLQDKRWIKFPDLPLPVFEKLSTVGLQCQVVKDKLVLCGGRWQGSITKHVLVYDPRTDRWQERQQMLSQRADFVSGVIDGQLYVAGGNNGVQSRTSSVDRYDLDLDRWMSAPNMQYETSFCMGVTLNSKLFVQAKGGVPRDTQVFCPYLGLWSSFEGDMLTSQEIHPHVVSNGQLYRADMVHGRFEIKAYDIGNDSWINMRPPLTIFAPTKSVKELVDLDRKLGIIMDDFSIAVVEIDLQNRSLKYQWFYLTSWNRAVDRIVSCHVLYA